MIPRPVTRGEFIAYWTPALIWAALLLTLSGKAGSGSLTGTAIQFLVSITVGHISDVTFVTVHFILRKCLHLIGYGLLGALNFRAVRAGRPGWSVRWSVIAVALAVLVASIDEFHQAFISERTGTALDVVIDACGAVLAVILSRADGEGSGASGKSRAGRNGIPRRLRGSE